MKVLDEVLSLVCLVLGGLVLFGAIDPPDQQNLGALALIFGSVAYGARAATR